MFVAVFVAVKRTGFTRAFLYIQSSQQISVHWYRRARNPLQMFLQDLFLRS